MARDFTIGFGNEPLKTTFANSTGITILVDDLIPTFPIDINSSLMYGLQTSNSGEICEQIGKRLSPMVINGAQEPYIVTTAKE